MLKIISWNIARREECWRALIESDADLALLQEAAPPPPDIADKFDIDPSPWRTLGAGRNRPWRTAVVKLSDRIDVQWLEPKQVEDAAPGELAVSRPGTLTAAVVTPGDRQPLRLTHSAARQSVRRPATDTSSYDRRPLRRTVPLCTEYASDPRT